MKTRIALASLACCAGLGCAARLAHPIQVRTAEAYLMKRTTLTERTQSGVRVCVEEVSLEVVFLPGGAVQELDFEPGLFSANQFSVTLADSGALRQVTLNSDPQVDETLAAAGNLIGKAAGAAAEVAAHAVHAPAERPSAGAPCKPSVSAKLALLACFLDPPPRPAPKPCPPDPAAW